MSKHTPGPWRVGTTGPNGCYTVGTEKGLMTAMVAHSINHPEQKEQAISDAALIAAAPELLEALLAFIDYDKSWDSENDVTLMIKYAEALKKAKASVAKALNKPITE